jgi:spermidine synthase
LAQRYLYLVVFVAGAAVLAIEILGTRILGPFYGVSLFLWSALITVTLVALSVGYAIGGRWADRRPSLPRLHGVLIAAGLWVLLIPWLRTPILAIAEPFGLRFAVLLDAFILFAFPLTLLGMVSPYAIRLRAVSLQVVGTTAGDLYAISTVGSVVAALLTGFVLIPNVGVDRLTLLVGGLLILTGSAGLALGLASPGRRRAALAALMLATLALAVVPVGGADPARGLLAVAQSPYAEIRVLDATDGQTRLLVIDGGAHTIVDRRTWHSLYPYVPLLGLARCAVAEPGRLLLIGAGGGSVIKDYARQGWRVDAVEIDPVVVDMAQRHFGLQASEARMFVMDGRRFLLTHGDTYDAIALDAFGSSSIPFHLVTEESFGLIASRLRPGGVLAINVESAGWHTEVIRAIAATLRVHFAHVVALPADADAGALGNLVILASGSPPDGWPGMSGDAGSADGCPLHANQHAQRGWSRRFVPDTRGAEVLSDDRNRIDVWSEQINVVARRDLHRYFDRQGLSSY